MVQGLSVSKKPNIKVIFLLLKPIGVDYENVPGTKETYSRTDRRTRIIQNFSMARNRAV